MKRELDALRIALDQAKREYGVAEGGGRNGAFSALGAVVDYLSDLGLEDDLTSPLRDLMRALADAERGIAHPLTTPDKRVGAPGKSVSALGVEQNIALVAECCVMHARSQGARPFLDTALAHAAKLVNHAHPEHHVTPARAREIRERVQQLPSGDQGRLIYDMLLDNARAGVPPLDVATALLRQPWL